MGLDVYLREGQPDEGVPPEPDYPFMHDDTDETDAEGKTIRKPRYGERGSPEYNAQDKIYREWRETYGSDKKSPNFPDHLCGVRYLRSSYNDGGFNTVVGNLLDKDLYWVFFEDGQGPDSETLPGYVPHMDAEVEGFDPNHPEIDQYGSYGGYWAPPPETLQACRERAVQLVSELEAAPNLRCFSVSADPIYTHASRANDDPNDPLPTSPVDTQKALAMHVAEQKRYAASRERWIEDHPGQDPDDPEVWGPSPSYSNAVGEFFHKGITVYGMIAGKDVLGRPCVHMVTEGDLEWYVTMAKIVVEFIDEALTMRQPRISWSG